MSVDSGNAVAQYNYGLHLMNGKSIEKDTKNGVIYLKKTQILEIRALNIACRFAMKMEQECPLIKNLLLSI